LIGNASTVEHDLAGAGAPTSGTSAQRATSSGGPVAIDQDLFQLNVNTVRATSPAFIARKASLMSSSRPRA